MAKKGRRATNEERLAAVQMYDNGLSADRIAEILGVGRSSVFDWVADYREGGLATISTKFASGRPTTLDDSEMIRLFTMINGRDPRTYSLGVTLWTRALIRDLIKKTFSKEVLRRTKVSGPCSYSMVMRGRRPGTTCHRRRRL